MATYEVIAFKWTGTFYNATYNTSYEMVLTDNDGSYEGSSDADETVSIDGGAPVQSAGPSYAIDCDFVAADGSSHVETFNFLNVEGEWYFIPSTDSAFSEGATLGTYQSHTLGWQYGSVVCFAKGTRIMTVEGEVLVEDLASGDLVLTLDGGYRPIRLNMSREVAPKALNSNAKLRPVKITAGALGKGLPKTDLSVSRQHRMLVSSHIAERMFGTSDVLIPAIRLTDLPGCIVDEECSSVCYHHLVFDRHEIVFANGSPSESFYPGPEAMKSIPHGTKSELMEIFPELKTGHGTPKHARSVPSGRLQAKLLARHQKNNRALAQTHMP